MPAGGEDLVVVVCEVLGVSVEGRRVKCELTFCDMDSVTGETCTLPNQRTFLGKKFGDFSTHELVADRLVAVWIQFVGVAHIPSSRSNSIIITDCLLNS